jgi:hypothetical protein
MPGLAREGLDAAGGAQRAGGQGAVHANGARVVVLGDPVAGHGEPPHAAPVMATCSPRASPSAARATPQAAATPPAAAPMCMRGEWKAFDNDQRAAGGGGAPIIIGANDDVSNELQKQAIRRSNRRHGWYRT